MANSLESLAIVASMLLVAAVGIAAEPQSDQPIDRNAARSAEQLQRTNERRREALTQEYKARISEFKLGRTPANVVLQASRRLLQASLDSNSPNAAIEYDRRASEVESMAQKNLELGTGTRQDVAQAKSSRLAAILKDLLSHSDSKDK